jgi:hypothetical protein
MMSRREALRTSLLARESEALKRLAAATGGQSLCALSGGGGPVSAVKYYEGTAAALAEARRAIRRLPDLPDGPDLPGTSALPGNDDASRLAIQDIRARWEAQSLAPGRTGRSWAGYLAGGLDALAQLLDEQPA